MKQRKKGFGDSSIAYTQKLQRGLFPAGMGIGNFDRKFRNFGDTVVTTSGPVAYPGGLPGGPLVLDVPPPPPPSNAFTILYPNTDLPVVTPISAALIETPVVLTTQGTVVPVSSLNTDLPVVTPISAALIETPVVLRTQGTVVPVSSLTAAAPNFWATPLAGTPVTPTWIAVALAAYLIWKGET